MAIKVAMTILCSSILNVILVVNASGDHDNKYYIVTLLSGEKIQCQKCKPGTYFNMDCTANGQEAACLPCKNDTYQPEFTLALSCAPCSTCKYPEFEYVSKNCTAIADTLCVCKSGYYRENSINIRDALCLKDIKRSCPIGYKVNVIGNSIPATTCVQCPDGYFSDTESFTDNCTKCRVCDYGIDTPCNASSDTKCKGKGLAPGEIVAVVLSIIVFIVICALVLLWKLGTIDLPCRNSQNYLSKKYKKVVVHRNHLELVCVAKESDKYVEVIAEPVNVNNDPPGVVSNLELLHLSTDLICPGWELLFHELFDGNASGHIERMNMDCKDTETKIHKLLLIWKETKKSGATKMQLTKALCARQMNNVTEKHFPQEYAQYTNARDTK